MADIYKQIPIIINIVFFSIPEEAFFVVFSLILLKRFDLLELSRKNIVKLSLIILPAAIISNLLRGIPELNMGHMPLIGIFTVFLLMIIAYEMWHIKACLKTIASVTVSFLIAMMIQLSYLPFILYGTSITMEELNKPVGLSFLLSLIDRVMQISMIGLAFIKKNSFIQANYIKVISQNMLLKIIGIFLLVFNFFYIYAISRSIYIDRILISMEFHYQILMITAVLLVPLVNILALFISVYHMENKEAKKRFAIQEEYKVSIADIDFFLKREEYEKIKKELDYLRQNTNELYKIKQ